MITQVSGPFFEVQKCISALGVYGRHSELINQTDTFELTSQLKLFAEWLATKFDELIVGSGQLSELDLLISIGQVFEAARQLKIVAQSAARQFVSERKKKLKQKHALVLLALGLSTLQDMVSNEIVRREAEELIVQRQQSALNLRTLSFTVVDTTIL
jgi:hypothetical protein